MRKYIGVVLLLVLTFSLGLGGIVLVSRLQKVSIKEPEVPRPSTLLDIKNEQADENTRSVWGHITDGDAVYGGVGIRGILTEVSDKPSPILLKDGERIANTALVLELRLFYKNGNSELIRIVKAIELGGQVYVVDLLPYKVGEIESLKALYSEKIGTKVFANFSSDKKKVIEEMRKYNRSNEEIALAELVFEAISRYEKSWATELERFKLGENRGDMNFLFPLIYTAASFDSKLGVYGIDGMSK